MPAFPPIISAQPHTLILGSMPSAISLRNRQYYANPQNRFWWIMSKLCNFSLESDYQARAKAITAQGFAVWDVLYDCERPGSADSKIVRASERPNNFNEFLEEYPSIKLIAFNGAAAKQIFMRHYAQIFSQVQNLASCQLPSTSPAYAAMRPDQKLERWRTELITR